MFQVSINGGATIDLGGITSTAGTGSCAKSRHHALNAAFNANAATRAAGLSASRQRRGHDHHLEQRQRTNFRLNLYGGTAVNAFGFGDQRRRQRCLTAVAW